MSELFDDLTAEDLQTKPQGFKQTLYKYDSSGSIRQWSLEVTDQGDHATIHIEAGLKDGKMVPLTTFVKNGKNAGRANATTYLQQAIADGQSKIKRQKKDGYSDDLDNLVAQGSKGSGALECMTAKAYDVTKKQSGSKDLKGLKMENVLVGLQDKFDGVRRFTHITTEGVIMYTRGGDPSDTLPHIEKELHASFMRLAEKKPSLLQTGLWIDGEAYCHDIPFNMINGITRKGAKTPEELEARYFIKYHVYDVASEEGYEIRSLLLEEFASAHVVPVKTAYVVATVESLKEYFEDAIARGYEGAMIRRLGVPYVHGRGYDLLKYKAFEDAEFIIVDSEESSHAGQIGAFILRMDQPAYDRANNLIETFKATPACSHVEKLWAWKNRESFVGQKVTVNFFGRSEYGVPRFGRVKGIRYDM